MPTTQGITRYEGMTQGASKLFLSLEQPRWPFLSLSDYVIGRFSGVTESQLGPTQADGKTSKCKPDTDATKRVEQSSLELSLVQGFQEEAQRPLGSSIHELVKALKHPITNKVPYQSIPMCYAPKLLALTFPDAGKEAEFQALSKCAGTAPQLFKLCRQGTLGATSGPTDESRFPACYCMLYGYPYNALSKWRCWIQFHSDRLPTLLRRLHPEQRRAVIARLSQAGFERLGSWRNHREPRTMPDINKDESARTKPKDLTFVLHSTAKLLGIEQCSFACPSGI